MKILPYNILSNLEDYTQHTTQQKIISKMLTWKYYSVREKLDVITRLC